MIESSTLAELPKAAARELRAGQERISATVRKLAAELDAGGEDDDCECLAMELDALLELQVDAERLTLHDPSPHWRMTRIARLQGSRSMATSIVRSARWPALARPTSNVEGWQRSIGAQYSTTRRSRLPVNR
jgi:hypothetical protein